MGPSAGVFGGPEVIVWLLREGERLVLDGQARLVSLPTIGPNSG